MDSRHPLQPFDVSMIEWTKSQALPLIALLNKSDKLKQNERIRCLRTVEAEIGNSDSSRAILFSATKGTGSTEVRRCILELWAKGVSFT